jgi:hypothetical protein
MLEGYHFFRKIHCLWFYRFFRTAMSYTSAEQYLSWNCEDWEIHKSDFGRGRTCEFRYTVRAYSSFARGTGLGKTALQAAKRAVKQMLRVRRQMSMVFDGPNAITDLNFEVK